MLYLLVLGSMPERNRFCSVLYEHRALEIQFYFRVPNIAYFTFPCMGTDSNIEALPSLKPTQKYCDISGLPVCPLHGYELPLLNNR